MKIYAVIADGQVEALYATREAAKMHVAHTPTPRHGWVLRIVEWEPWEGFDKKRFDKKGYLRAAFCGCFGTWETE